MDISTDKIVRVIFLSREFGPDSQRLRDYISGLNADEAASLVAVMWVGRESFAPADFAQAVTAALEEATAPTEAYLAGNPQLAGHLEAGLEALGYDVIEAEDQFRYA